MPDNLAKTPDGRVAFRYNSTNPQVPWHGLGTKFPGLMFPAHAVRGIADFEVIATPMQTRLPDGRVLPIDNQFAIVRPDTGAILSAGAGRQYAAGLWTNKDMLDFLTVIADGQPMVDTIGVLGVGETVWVLCKLPDSAVLDKDLLHNYFLVANFFTPGHALVLKYTNIRVVCQNTLLMALRRANELTAKIVHSTNIKVKVEAAKDSLKLVQTTMADSNGAYALMAQKTITDDLARDFFKKVFVEGKGNGSSAGSEARRRELYGMSLLAESRFQVGDGAALFPGTMWNALNAVTDVIDHTIGRRGQQAHAHHAMFGSGAAIKARAAEMAAQYVGA